VVRPGVGNRFAEFAGKIVDCYAVPGKPAFDARFSDKPVSFPEFDGPRPWRRPRSVCRDARVCRISAQHSAAGSHSHTSLPRHGRDRIAGSRAGFGARESALRMPPLSHCHGALQIALPRLENPLTFTNRAHELTRARGCFGVSGDPIGRHCPPFYQHRLHCRLGKMRCICPFLGGKP